MRKPALLALGVAALLIGACGGDDDHQGAATAKVDAAQRSFTVTSTLDGRRVLPHRLRWLAFPKLKGADVASVAFVIDGGKPRWVEEQPPYTFSDDENGAHKGYLVTSWLSPGTHRFTVRAVASDGRRSADTVVARVRRAPAPPGGLGGVWQRTLSDTSDAPVAGTAGNPTDTYTPPGRYEMVIDRRWIQMRWPGKYKPPQSDKTGYGWITDSDYTARPTTLRALGAVTFDTHHGQAELGWWCWPDGPPGTYRWSTVGDTLTLKPKGHDPCAVRGYVWTGDWKRRTG